MDILLLLLGSFTMLCLSAIKIGCFDEVDENHSLEFSDE